MLPVTSDIATMNRFPNECPSRPSAEPSGKRYWNSRVISGSASASAAMQLRRSPGGITPSSRRSRPDDPPSSATVTIAVRLSVYSFSPRSSTESPVPPPRQTIRGPRPDIRCRCSRSTSDSSVSVVPRTEATTCVVNFQTPTLTHSSASAIRITPRTA